jgi:putative transposase
MPLSQESRHTLKAQSIVAWVESVYHRRVHTSTGKPPLQRWLAGAPFAQPTPAQLREAFLWAEDRLVRKTATVSLFGNAYEVDPFLVGRHVELVFDPFDLTHIEVRHNGKPFGLATPQDIGRHVHRRARPDHPDQPAAATGIDYLHQVEAEHAKADARRINFDALTSQPAQRPIEADDNGPSANDAVTPVSDFEDTQTRDDDQTDRPGQDV